MPCLPPIPEHTSSIILAAVQEHDQKLGVGSLALVLKGSKNKRIKNRELFNSRFFGALFYCPIDVIENYIKQLIEKKLIQSMLVEEFPYPVPLLTLNKNAKQLLELNIDLPLNTLRTVKKVKLNESMQQTLELFKSNRSISMTAQQRELAESTIWTHLIACVKLGHFSAVDVVEREKVKVIIDAKEKLKTRGLKELKEALPDNISYEELRCVLAEERDNKNENYTKL